MNITILSGGLNVSVEHIKELKNSVERQAIKDEAIDWKICDNGDDQYVTWMCRGGCGWVPFEMLEWESSEERKKTYAEFIQSEIILFKERDTTTIQEEIVIFIDLDDMILPGAFRVLRQAFADPNCWVVHGGYKCKSGNPALFNGRYYPEENFRTSRWRGSHLKAVRAGLLQRLSENEFRGPDGNWLPMCSDLALMLPCMEMAGHDRIRYNKKVVYEYDDTSPLNDHKVNPKLQKELEAYIRSRPPRARLETL